MVRSSLAALVALWLGGAAAHAAERLVTVTHVAAEQVGARLEARVTLDMPAQARVFLLPAPAPRLVIDLPPAAVALNAGRASEQGERELGPARLRFARHSRASTRLVFDLPAEGRGLHVQRSLVGGDLRYVVSLSLAAAPRRSAPRPPLLQPARYERDPAPLIVLDAGHGGRDPGARGAHGSLEKDITLAAALELSELLKANGYRVRLTREDDGYVSLEERVARARGWSADLFLSLHSDASSSEHTFGASVYTLSEAGGARAKRLRKAQHAQGEGADPLVSDILFDLSQQSSVDRSSSFAETLLKHLEGVGPVLRNARRTAGFYVLLAPDVPAVLLEMGFLTNPEDESRLASPSKRSRLLQAVALAIDEHFASRTLLASSESAAGLASP